MKPLFLVQNPTTYKKLMQRLQKTLYGILSKLKKQPNHMAINMKMGWLVLIVVNVHVFCEQKFKDHLRIKNCRVQKT